MFNLQPTNLQNEVVKLVPLKAEDFENLYAIASDPLIWEQHPVKDRYQRGAFSNYFDGAVKSGGAFLVFDAQTDALIGSSRFYDYDQKSNSIYMGYTFITRNYWGKTHNKALKLLMLNYILDFVETVFFHIGATNFRSQKAIEKLGAEKISEKEQEVAYFGEASNPNFKYKIDKAILKRILERG